MNASEAARILAVLSSIDSREFDATKAQGWAWALEDIEYERGLEAAKRAVKAGDKYVDIQSIRHQLKAMQPRFEADVRSAKLRGVIPETWPARKPLPIAVEQKLHAMQALDYRANNDLSQDAIAAAATSGEIEQ